ncbi:MAG: heavy metal-binding domain-containing protein [Candidatus Ranarchaeia archaeon]|jgi:uncharacterized protein YbjQ (UPF0145 family)
MCGKKDDKTKEKLPRLLLATGSQISGYRVSKTIGLIYGLTVRTRGLGGKFLASLRGLAGGEMGSFVDLAHELRGEALERLNEVAHQHGANAVIDVRFDSNDMSTGDQFSGTEMCAYGTAVVVEPV